MSNTQFRAPRGTSDTLPVDQPLWTRFHHDAAEAAARFGYDRIDTPVFENAGLFVRSVGATTDIVEKETYTFEDRGGDLLTLKPEGTAPVCRAYLEHGMHNLPQPVRLHYLMPMFRYDRPQAGRFRQLHQFGVEAIGDADPSVDAEVVELGWRFLQDMGLEGLSLKLNSIGDSTCRPAYIGLLQEYYRSHVDDICADCRRRLEKNPLRLLDCKEDRCQPVIAQAPVSADHLCDACQEHWAGLTGHLRTLRIAFELDGRLVRGLDYYTRTVFEVAPSGGGAQSAIFGGGRYDGLMEQLGGKPTPGIGFGMGIERVLLNLKAQGVGVTNGGMTKVLVATLGAAAKEAGLELASRLRREGIAALLGPPGRSLKGQLRYASAVNATHAAIIGERELEQGNGSAQGPRPGRTARAYCVRVGLKPDAELVHAFASGRMSCELTPDGCSPSSLRDAVFVAAVLISAAIVLRATDVIDRFFIYFPERDILQTPGDRGLEYEDVEFEAADGTRLHGWLVPSDRDMTLVWFHGNAGNIGHRVDNLAALHERIGATIFIFDYRGYGRSEGSPSEDGTYLDAEGALDYLASRADLEGSKTVLFGRSLGAAVAAEVAIRRPAHALVLESGFTSIPDMARRHYPFLAGHR